MPFVVACLSERRNGGTLPHLEQRDVVIVEKVARHWNVSTSQWALTINAAPIVDSATSGASILEQRMLSIRPCCSKLNLVCPRFPAIVGVRSLQVPAQLVRRQTAYSSSSRSSFRPFSSFNMDQDMAREKTTSGINEWKQRPPYRVHESNEHFDAKYEGNCHCGKVKFQLSREEPLDSKLCHCTTCQTQHGEYSSHHFAKDSCH